MLFQLLAYYTFNAVLWHREHTSVGQTVIYCWHTSAVYFFTFPKAR